MSTGKRSNIAIWRLTVPSDVTPSERIDEVVAVYDQLVEEEPAKYRPLQEIRLVHQLGDVSLALYVRNKTNVGFLPFVSDYLADTGYASLFQSTNTDACLFIATTSSLFAITSGAGYHIIEGLVDYAFPFDTAKKIIANSFNESAVREIAGGRTSRVDTYRRGYSIERSDAFGRVWKRLVGRIDSSHLASESYLRTNINPHRPPAVEIKGAFVLRKRLDLAEIVTLATELETLPEPSAEQALQLSFLDNLYPIRNNKGFNEILTEQFVEAIRRALVDDAEIDLDVSDPADITRYAAGSDFKIDRREISMEPFDGEVLLGALRDVCASTLESADQFLDHILSLVLSYVIDPDDPSTRVRDKLINFLHGEVEHEGETFFRLDKVWYRSQGAFLDNLKQDFIQEVFSTTRPVLLDGRSFLRWNRTEDEGAFNKRQALEPGFYYGDKLFARSDRGKVELFDLLKVDEPAGQLYIIHSKDRFDAKMRDACSQIAMSSEVIGGDLDRGSHLLASYFDEWAASLENKGISKSTFLGWFKLELVYVILCSTRHRFVQSDFEKDVLHSHIARREILATKNEFRGRGLSFRLAHTQRE